MRHRAVLGSLVVVTFLVASVIRKPPPGPRRAFLATTPQAVVIGSTYFVDPANVSTCAHDTNSCQSATCGSGGVGPCLHYVEITRKWGSTCPTITHNVTVTFLSSQSDDSDPVIPCVESTRPAFLEITAALPATCTATLSNVTPKNRTTNQLLQAQAGACLTGGDLAVQNLTHPSVAWSMRPIGGAGGNIYSISQPADNNSYVSVDSWTVGDSVSIGDPIKVNIQNVRTPGNVVTRGFGYQIWVHDVTIWSPLDLGLANFYLDGAIVYMHEVKFSGIGELYANRMVSFECDNCDFGEGMEINVKPGGEAGNGAFLWGMIHGGFTKFGASVIGGDIALFGDGSPFHQFETTMSGAVYVSGDAVVQLLSSSIMATNGNGFPSGPAVFWGPGVVQTLASSQLTYPAPASAAFKGPTLKLHSATTGCALDVSTDPAAMRCNRPVTPSSLDTPVADGGLGGCALGTTGSSICSN